MFADNLIEKSQKLIVVGYIAFMGAYPLTGSVNALSCAQQPVSSCVNQRHLATETTQSLGYCQSDPTGSARNHGDLVIK